MYPTLLELVDTNLCWSSSVEQDIVRILSHFTLFSTLSQPGSSTTSSPPSVSTLVVSVWCQHLYWYLMSHGHHCPVLLKYLEPRQLTMSTLLSHDASAHSDLIQPLVPGLGAGHYQLLSLSSDQIRNSTDLCSILNLVVGKEPDLTNKLMLLHIVTFIVFFCTNMILHNFQRSKPLRKLGSNIIWECRGWGRRMFENIYSCAKKGWGKTINHENF